MDLNLSSPATPITPPTLGDDELSWLRLIRSRRIGAVNFHRLRAEHGSAAGALAYLPTLAAAAGLQGYTPCPEYLARQELEMGAARGLRLIRSIDADYPPELRELIDAPPVLWLKGQASSLQRPMVAVIGARNVSSLGRRMAAKLSHELCEAGYTVVSGLARGTDTAAHEATAAQGTVAVLAGGADVIYPPENAELARLICQTGALLSEQPPGLQPLARHFPARNRIVSGMALGVLIIEATEGSGSLITARHALDQGREVMALPGHPIDPRMAGGNRLLREGATLVRSLEDIEDALASRLAAALARRPPSSPASSPLRDAGSLAEMAAGAPLGAAVSATPNTRGTPPRPRAAASAKATSRAAVAAELQASVLEQLSLTPLPIDQLMRQLSIGLARLEPELLSLELSGAIERLPGGFLARAS